MSVEFDCVVRYLYVAMFLLSLSACASRLDTKSNEQRSCTPNSADVEAQQTLVAARKFLKERYKIPSSMEDMVPDYLDHVPNQSNIEYNSLSGEFFYSFIISDLLGCQCRAKVGDKAFRCSCD